MRRKRWLYFAVAGALLLGLTACGQTNMSSVEDTVNVDTKLPQENEAEECDGYTTETDWFEYDGNRIFGRFYYPQDFDESQKYTTVLLCQGGNITADIWDGVFAPGLAKQGYVCYAFDCRSGTGDSKAERTTYSDPAPDGKSSVNTYAEDMEAALSFIESKEFVDLDSIYLMGQSQGGMTAQIVAAKRPEETAGVIVLYGSVTDNYRKDVDNFDQLEDNPYNNGEVFFIQGTEDNFRTPQDTIDNMKWYDKTSFTLISNANHGFGNNSDRPSSICADEVISFIERTKAERAGEEYRDDSAPDDYLTDTEEGSVYEGDGYTVSAQWIETERGRVFGRFYYPEDFDETEIYTTVVMCHGGSITADIWDAVYAPRLARAGYVCYAFDCRSGTGESKAARQTYSDPAPGGTATVETYSEDLEAAYEFVRSKSYTDQDKLYLMGQSMGGLTVQNVAAKHQEDVKGVIVLYGSIGEDNRSMISDYDELKAAPYSSGEVLFVQGSEDVTLTPERTMENMSWYEESELILINDAYHGFGNSPSRPAEICIESVIDFIERTLEGGTD